MTLRDKLEAARSASFVGDRVEMVCSEYRAMLDALIAAEAYREVHSDCMSKADARLTDAQIAGLANRANAARSKMNAALARLSGALP